MEEGRFRIKRIRYCPHGYWEVIDDRDQTHFSGLEELFELLNPKKKKYNEQDYNVHVYKVLPYPPGSKERQGFLGLFDDV
ncbi:MAG TPA: hypothetical protein VMT57_06975 [Candidatus Thermoplasmatota archaeon]|nr:hypothetical protein [Candidatus Thermoplasmatota archaeon]